MEGGMDPRQLSVAIGFPCGPMLPYETSLSLTATANLCGQLGIPFQMHTIAGSSIVTTARNAVLTKFLVGDSSRLFWIDSDIVWTPADFLRLVQLTEHVDVVAGAYPLKREDRAVIINGAKAPYTTNEWGLVRVESLGLGFTCVRREVVEQWAATKPRKMNRTASEELVEAFVVNEFGEDVNFFNDIRALGHEVWLDPSVSLGHVGTQVYRRDIADALGLEVTHQE